MRLIAMSAHSQLKQSQSIISSYNYELTSIFAQLNSYAPHWNNPIFHPETLKKKNVLVLLIGSQKGLCGSFNNHLFKLTTNEFQTLSNHDISIIAIGQKIIEFTSTLSMGKIKHSYRAFSINLVAKIAHEITHTIMHADPHYQSVVVISNHFKNFFVQKPQITSLIPFAMESSSRIPAQNELLWEQKPQNILDELVPAYLTCRLQSLMVNSLLAEHAARFISMDSATRNAEGFLDATQLEYNKLRQSKITKELTELSGSY